MMALSGPGLDEGPIVLGPAHAPSERETVTLKSLQSKCNADKEQQGRQEAHSFVQDFSLPNSTC